MQHRRRLPLRAALALAALVPLAAPARSLPLGGDEFYRAYYLEHEAHDVEGALALYGRVAADASASREQREAAERAAKGLAEDLAASDLARLMPADTILYAELSRPGEQIEGLLRQLGLLNESGAVSERFGVSPALIEGLLGLRGAALAITAIDPNGGPPHGVFVAHPGELTALRGLVETALAAQCPRAEAVAGFPTFRTPDGSLVSLGERVIIAGNDPRALEGVLRRLKGEKSASLADDAQLAPALEGRRDDLLHLCLNAAPVRPMVEGMLRQQAAHDPQAAMALQLLDPASVVALAGRLAVGKERLALELSLHLDEEHENLVFDLLRMPAIGERTLALVPQGAAFFLAAALNEPAPRAAQPVAQKAERIAVSWMDFGREFFGNLVDLAIFALPPAEGASSGARVPDVAAVLRSNDVARSHALWKLVLGLASESAVHRGIEPEAAEIGGVHAEVYSMGEVPVFVAQTDGALVFGVSRGALERTFAALRAERSVASDPAFARPLERIDRTSTMVALVHPGRCAEIAKAFVPPRELNELAPVFALFGDLVVGLALEHGDAHLALRARIENLPDVSGFVTQAIAAQREHGGAVVGRSATRVPAPAPPGADARRRFDQSACERHDRAGALAVAHELVASLAGDPNALNDFAWSLLTEDRYRGEYDELALHVSEVSNQMSGQRNWYYLDTLALAAFRNGDAERAVDLEAKALELAGDSAGSSAVAEALRGYREALKERSGR